MPEDLMVDLHSHILPDIDDGAKDLDEAVSLIKMELSCGIDTIVATPHFDFEHDHIEEFLLKRQNALKSLKNTLTLMDIDVKISEGAEVYLSPRILEDKLKNQLCYAGTNYMLVELPMVSFPEWIPQVLYQLKLEGITPVIAHVERYPYIQKHPDILYDIVNAGSITQVNAASLVLDSHKMRNIIFNFMKHNLIHIIASDAHSVNHRPPVIDKAMQVIEKRFGNEMTEYFKINSEAIVANLELELLEAVEI
jgi:protein-tyrosine phosphatase